MSAHVRNSVRRHRSRDIDITPLIDVLFMLIIFFVLTASFLQGKIEVELPAGDTQEHSTEKAILVMLKSDGSIKWGDFTVTSDELFVRVSESLSLKQEILVAGDRSVAYGKVIELLDTLRRGGLERAGLALQSLD